MLQIYVASILILIGTNSISSVRRNKMSDRTEAHPFPFLSHTPISSFKRQTRHHPTSTAAAAAAAAAASAGLPSFAYSAPNQRATFSSGASSKAQPRQPPLDVRRVIPFDPQLTSPSLYFPPLADLRQVGRKGLKERWMNDAKTHEHARRGRKEGRRQPKQRRASNQSISGRGCR